MHSPSMELYIEQSLSKIDEHLTTIGFRYERSDKKGFDGMFYSVYKLTMNDKTMVITFSDIYHNHAINLFIMNLITFTMEDVLMQLDKFIQQQYFSELVTIKHKDDVYKCLIKTTFDNKTVIQLPNYQYKILEREEVKML